MKRKRGRKDRRRIWRRLGILAGVVAAGWLGYLGFEAKVVRDFEAIDAVSPTRVVARPLVLRPGDRMEPRHVASHLTRAGYRSVSKRTPDRGEFAWRGGELRLGRRALRVEHAVVALLSRLAS